VVAALIGFRNIKEPAAEDSLGVESNRATAMARTGAH